MARLDKFKKNIFGRVEIFIGKITIANN